MVNIGAVVGGMIGALAEQSAAALGNRVGAARRGNRQRPGNGLLLGLDHLPRQGIYHHEYVLWSCGGIAFQDSAAMTDTLGTISLQPPAGIRLTDVRHDLKKLFGKLGKAAAQAGTAIAMAMGQPGTVGGTISAAFGTTDAITFDSYFWLALHDQSRAAQRDTSGAFRLGP